MVSLRLLAVAGRLPREGLPQARELRDPRPGPARAGLADAKLAAQHTSRHGPAHPFLHQRRRGPDRVRMRRIRPAANAGRLLRATAQLDVCAAARQVKCPTLVLHPRHDKAVPFEEGRLLASLIPGARGRRSGARRPGPRQRAGRRASGDGGKDRAQSHHPYLRQARGRKPPAGDRARAGGGIGRYTKRRLSAAA